MSRSERPLDLAHQLALYRSITKALTKIVLAREAWIEHVEKYGECYCQNPFRAHVDNAEQWSRFHMGDCAVNPYWKEAVAERHKAAESEGAAGPEGAEVVGRVIMAREHKGEEKET